MESSISAITLSNQQSWKQYQARIHALMEDEYILSQAARRVCESTAYAKSAGSHAEMIKRIREQKSFEQEIVDAYLRKSMLGELERGLAVPAWRVLTPEGDFLILTPFEQRERMLAIVSRFMVWKLATAFVLTTKTWLGPERTCSGEEVVTIGVSRHERLVIRRIRRTPAVAFAPPEWISADSIDENYFRLLPSGQSIVTAEEAAMLADVFREDGALPARRLS